MKVVPQLLYQHAKVNKIMVDGLSSIVYKSINTIDTDTDHYVASHVLSVVLKGELQLQTYYEGERFSASQDQMVFIPKGRYMISDIIPEGGAFQAVFFFIEDEIIDEFMKSKAMEEGEGSVDYILDYAVKIQLFTSSILALYQNENNEYKELTKMKLLELLHLIYHSGQKAKFIKILYSLRNITKRSLSEIMEQNFDKPLSIEDYAFLTGRSVSSFRRDFKRKFQTTPKKWLNGKKLEKAKQLLITTNRNVQQISLEVGIDNVSHFISLFGKAFKETPKQFLIRNRISKIY